MLAISLLTFNGKEWTHIFGLIKTDFAKAIWDSPEGEKRAKSDIPLGRLGETDDFKGIAVYLASDASSYMTGQALTICGGSNMWT